MKRSLSVRVRSVANSVILVIAMALAILLMPASQADARDIYVDPARPTAGADGSSANPWHSLDAVFENETLEPGDTVYLRSGDYGGLWINQRRNEATVTIAADRGHVPRFGAIRISASSHWHLRGLSVSPAYGKPDARGIMLKIDRNAEAITVEDCTLMSAPDSSSWSIEDWNAKAYRGIFAQGTRITLRGNRLRNVSHGISMWAPHSLVENNVIENFSGDGMRGLGDHTTFRSNTVKNCYSVNDNHDDGFQSWSVGADGKPGSGEIVGVTLSANRFINYEDPKQPFRCTMQGIGLFDGIYVDWVIENNVVITDHWHGITVMGARNVRIVNNTVIDPNRVRPGPPWVTITAHKNGTPPENSFMINNLAPSFSWKGVSKLQLAGSRNGVTSRNNMRVLDPAVYFRNPAKGDLRLIPGSRPVDAGTLVLTPAEDIDGAPRLRGKSVDVGAHELQ